MKQNKKIVVIVITIMTMLLTSIPVFGYSDTSTNHVDFSGQPIPYIPYDEISYGNAGIAVWRSADTTAYVSVQTTGRDVYAFYAQDKSGNDGTTVCSLSGAAYTYTRFRNSNNSMINKVQHTLGATSNGFYYDSGGFPYYSGATTLIPIFATLSDGINAVNDWILNPPTNETANIFNYSLPAGNVIYIDISNTDWNSLYFTKFTNVPHAPSDTDISNVAVGYADSIPETFNLPIDGTSVVSLNPQGSANIYGKYQNWSYSHGISTGYHYLVIVNPTYAADDHTSDGYNFNDNPSATNGYLQIKVDQAWGAKVFPLKATWVYENGTGSIESESGSDPLDVNYDPNSQQWVTTDQNGNVTEPSIGGEDNIDIPSATQSIWNYLQNIATTISGFFNGAIGAISTLINAGHNFIGQLQGLYAWLPPPVYSVLCAALILVITIGVIKVFL